MINNQQSELYNLCYNSIYKTQLIKTNCKLSDPFDLKSLKCNNNETYLICNDRKVILDLFIFDFFLNNHLIFNFKKDKMLAKEQFHKRAN